MGKKLLVADDSVTIQKVIKLALSSEGYDILAVSAGKETIKAIEQERPCVVLIDLALPGADAYEVKKAINENPDLSFVRFILLSSAFEKVDEKLASEVDFHGRLIKPFDPSLLRKTVAEQMSQVSEPVVETEPEPEKVSEPPAPPAEPMPPVEELTSAPSTPPPFTPAPVAETTPPLEDLPPVEDMHPTLDDSSVDEATMTTTSEINSVEVSNDPVAEPSQETADNDSLSTVAAQDVPSTPSPKDGDIQGLTESTIKLSGMDDYQWSLDDGKRMKDAEPENTGQVEVTKPLEFQNKQTQLKQAIQYEDRQIDDGGSNFLSMGLKAGPGQLGNDPTENDPPPSFVNRAPGKAPDFSSSGSQWIEPPSRIQSNEEDTGSIPRVEIDASPDTSSISRAEIEELVKRNTEKALQKVIQEALPGIAEKVIRQEIAKILDEK